MKSYLRIITTALFSIALFTTGTAKASVITLNGVCEVNSPCDSTTLANTAILYGGVSGPANFDFFYTAMSGDLYEISGQFFASYGSSGSVFSVDMNVVYSASNAGPSSALDVLDLDVLQDVYDPGPGTYDGYYTEVVPATIGPNLGSTAILKANVLYDNQGVGQLTFSGPGNYYQTASADLTGLNGDYLYEDFQLQYLLGPGALPGSGVSVLPGSAPEPAETIPAAIALGLCAIVVLKRKGLVKFSK
jgi:hypothetical protein